MVRIISPFWSRQPVFHPYNMILWSQPPRVIEPALPDTRVPVDQLTVTTVTGGQIGPEDRQKVTELLRDHYLRTARTNYLPSEDHIFSYLRDQSHPAFVGRIRGQGQLDGVVTARPLHIQLRAAGGPPSDFDTYYVDNLCVRKDKRKRGLAEKAIATIYYELRHRNDGINTCLFKREGGTMWIRPLVSFSTRGLLVKHLIQSKRITVLAQPLVERVKEGQSAGAWTEMATKTRDAACAVRLDPGIFRDLVRRKQLLVYRVRDTGLYVFRRTCCIYPEGEAIECISSFPTGAEPDPALFFRGFALAVSAVAKDTGASVVLLEETGGNVEIGRQLAEEGITALFKCPTTFFLYNHSARQVPAEDVHLLY
jgi:hypothetical protein